MVANNIKLNPELLEPTLIELTYSELKTLRDNSQLVPGTQYRITDYATMVNPGDNTITSAGHPFDIIVVADDVNRLSEDARAAKHTGDTYFADSNLAAWKLNYRLDNDDSRFAWTYALKPKGIIVENDDRIYYRYPQDDDSEYEYGICWKVGFSYLYTNTENPTVGAYATYEPSNAPDDTAETITRTTEPVTTEGKGVIYRMIDEFNNDIPYDFKNIQFYRKWNSENELWCDKGTSEDGVAAYTFSSKGSSSTTQFTDFSLDTENNIYNNTIIIPTVYLQPFIISPITLNVNCFFGQNCYNNILGDNCYDNIFGNDCYNNIFDSTCIGNILNYECHGNTFGYGCFNNILNRKCSGNNFGSQCNHNLLGASNHTNTFGSNCNDNAFGMNCGNITFGFNSNNNLFDIDCSNNTFGSRCSNNVFGRDISNNKFGNNCSNITFSSNSAGSATGRYFQYITIPRDVKYLILYNTETASSNAVVKDYNIKIGISGTSSNPITINTTRNLNYETTVALNSSEEVKIYCEADLIQ